MKSRLFSHDFNLSSALFQMAFQVKFLASRGENSKEMFMPETSTAYSYQQADAFDVDASTMESFEAGLLDDKLTDIFVTACSRKRTMSMNKTATGAKLVFGPGDEFIIRDLDKKCFDPNRVVQHYISDDPRLTNIIYDLIQETYAAGYPENFPSIHFSNENNKGQLHVTGTKEQIILFTDALIAMANQKEMKLAVQEEKKSELGL